MNWLLITTLLEKSDNGTVAVLMLGPACAIGFYMWVWKRYRNQDKSYLFERTTSVKLSEVRGFDNKVRHISRTRETHVENWSATRNPRDRIRRR